MNVDEQQLHDPLHRLTPEPPLPLDWQPTQARQPGRWDRWAEQVAAAAVALLVLGAVLADHVLAGRDRSSVTTPVCPVTPDAVQAPGSRRPVC